MTVTSERISAVSVVTADNQPDLAGRSHMMRNVVGSWICQLAFVVAGFVLPRVVDRRIGQESLGIWDLGWSIEAYFGLASFGLVGAISRHIAQARAARDTKLLRAVASVGMLLYLFTGTVVLGLTLATTYLVPTLFGDRLGARTTDAQWVICLVGVSLAVEFYTAVFAGVLTGCHQWIWYNGIASGAHLLAAAGMIVAVLLGYGLRTMAGITLAGKVVAGLLRLVAAYRCCPGLSISPRHARRDIGLDMFWYGGKSTVYVIASVFMRETTRVMVLGYLGPAALALYSRPMTLVNHAAAFGTKFAHVFAPTSSAYQATHNLHGLRELMIIGGRYALYLSLPIVVILAISGQYILRLWMGERYDSGLVLAILALGNLPILFQLTSMEIVRGMNRHGLPSLAFLIFAAVGIPIAALFLGYLRWGIVGGAIATVIPQALLYGILIPAYACHLVGLPVGEYLEKTVPGPVLANIPLALCLLASRALWPNSVAANLILGLGAGVSVLGVIYWNRVLPERIKARMVRLVSPRGSAA